MEDSTGDIVLLLGLADALDENTNLLKLGRVRVHLDPPIYTANARTTNGSFTQLLRLASGVIELRNTANGMGVDVWVDANSSTLRVAIRLNTSITGALPTLLHANITLDNWRLGKVQVHIGFLPCLQPCPVDELSVSCLQSCMSMCAHAKCTTTNAI